jgi:hypothetical protein
MAWNANYGLQAGSEKAGQMSQGTFAPGAVAFLSAPP